MKVTIRTKPKSERCGYEWLNRKEDVRICPRCKSAYWDEPMKTEKEDKKHS